MRKSTKTAIFFFPALLLTLHIIIVPLKIYEIYPWFDIPMHTLGGLTIALSGFIFLKYMQSKNQLGKTSPPLFFLFIISIVSLAAVFWEFAEFILDLLTNLNAQNGLADTMADLAFGIFGGILGYSVANSLKV